MKQDNVLANVAWGVAYGLVLAALLLITWVGISILVGTSIVAEQGLSWWSAIGMVATIGLVVGAVLGLIRPLARYMLGAMLMGVIGAAGTYFIGTAWMFGLEAVRDLWHVLLFISVIAGAPAGWYLRFKYG